jgi:hypothetical protein
LHLAVPISAQFLEKATRRVLDRRTSSKTPV